MAPPFAASPVASLVTNAFVSSLPSTSKAILHTTSALSAFPITTIVDPASFAKASIGFFGGCRLPSSLIAGSSVAAIFSLVNEASQSTQELEKRSHFNRLEWVVLRLYHTLAVLAFCLSMTTIVTTTTASTSLLLGRLDPTPYQDVYHFLRGELQLEFMLTRWSFLTSVLMFWTSVASRLLLELQLLKRGRLRGALAVGLTLLGFLTGNVSKINDTLTSWPNLAVMAVDLVRLLGQRALETRGPLQILSLLSLMTGAFCGILSLFAIIWSKPTLPNEQKVHEPTQDREKLER